MKIRRLLYLVSSITMGLSSILVINFGHAYAVGPYTCTWTGAGGDTNFSTAANWSGCNGAAPVAGDGDNLVFDGAAANLNPHNDLVGATFGSITFSGASNAFNLDGNGFTMTGGMSNTGEQFSVVLNDITISGSQAIDVSGADISLGGNLSGSGDLSITGDQVVFLAGDNSAYSGGIDIVGGELWPETTTALGDTSGTTVVESGAILLFNLSASGTVAEPLVVSGSGAGLGFNNFALGSYTNGNQTLTLSGDISLPLGDIAVAPGSFRSDKLILSGAITGSHKINVAQGQYGDLVLQSSSNSSQTANGTYQAPKVTTTLTDNNNLPVSVQFNETYIIDGTESSVYVGDGGTLKGTGTLGDTQIDTGGTVAPGHSPGCLNTGNLSLSGTLEEEIGGATACSGYDQLNVTGTVDVTGSTLTTSLYGNYKPKAGESYVIVKNDGADAVTGTFQGLPEGATFKVSDYVFKVSYKGGDGNDIVLSVVTVPAAPDTGFSLTSAKPGLTLAGTSLASVSILVIARQNKKRATIKR